MFFDEHPDSISAPSFMLDNTADPFLVPGTLYSFPSSMHNGSGTLSFADGHVELHRWVDPRTRPPVQYSGYLGLGVSMPDSLDLAWLQRRCIPPDDQLLPTGP